MKKSAVVIRVSREEIFSSRATLARVSRYCVGAVLCLSTKMYFAFARFVTLALGWRFFQELNVNFSQCFIKGHRSRYFHLGHKH